MNRYNRSLFIFRRDLRLTDNTALNAALRQSQQVIACFIFDPRQITAHPYQSRPGLQFMLEALEDLQLQIAAQGGQLYLFQQRPEQVIETLSQQQHIQAVFVNRDYTPFSRSRDPDMAQHCLQLGVDFHSYGDLLLNEPEQVLKTDGTAYQVFTAFCNRARQIPVGHPQQLAAGRFCNDPPLPAAGLLQAIKQPHHYALSGGHRPALAILESTLPDSENYLQQRDFPALTATSQLSAYLKFGCCSVREVYDAIRKNFGDEHALLRQLYWRDFFTHIGFHYPHVFAQAFHKRFDSLPWQNDAERFRAWTNGLTGFPIVDAAMRELQQTGWMHNRLRMITASFLVKDLHISWRWGERHFARHLLDYDPCLNNGNWQWAASTGCDAQPYFRIFNPWLQQRKFDAECRYIKHWLPELQNYTAKQIHNWQLTPLACDYPPPIVDHHIQSQQIKKLFQGIADNPSTSFASQSHS